MLRFGLGRAFVSPNTVVKLAPEGCPDAAGTMAIAAWEPKDAGCVIRCSVSSSCYSLYPLEREHMQLIAHSMQAISNHTFVTKYLLLTGRAYGKQKCSGRDYFLPNTSLAMVANCMLDVPS